MKYHAALESSNFMSSITLRDITNHKKICTAKTKYLTTKAYNNTKSKNSLILNTKQLELIHNWT